MKGLIWSCAGDALAYWLVQKNLSFWGVQFLPLATSLCCVLGQKYFTLFTNKSLKVLSRKCQGNMTIDTGVRWVGRGGLGELVSHSGGVVITLVIIFIITFVIIHNNPSCYRNQNKILLDGPFGLRAEITIVYWCNRIIHIRMWFGCNDSTASRNMNWIHGSRALCLCLKLWQ